MFISNTSMEAFLAMNIHKCIECGMVFINFKGTKGHLDEHGHEKFQLIKANNVKKLRCGKCQTHVFMYQISCGPKETDLTWWCPNCKDRIGVVSEVEDEQEE